MIDDGIGIRFRAKQCFSTPTSGGFHRDAIDEMTEVDR
jgi:hypothetical protein